MTTRHMMEAFPASAVALVRHSVWGRRNTTAKFSQLQCMTWNMSTQGQLLRFFDEGTRQFNDPGES